MGNPFVHVELMSTDIGKGFLRRRAYEEPHAECGVDVGRLRERRWLDYTSRSGK